ALHRGEPALPRGAGGRARPRDPRAGRPSVQTVARARAGRTGDRLGARPAADPRARRAAAGCGLPAAAGTGRQCRRRIARGPAVLARSAVTGTPIANDIRRLRFERGEMTQQALAEACRVTRQTIIALEAGRYAPSLELAFRIARAFGVGVEDVFRWEGA